MKTELTTEQSQHLIEFGVPDEKASLCEQAFDDGYRKNPIFTLTDVLEILESMKDCDFIIKHWKEDGQDVWTGEIVEECVNWYSHSDELIDVLYELTVGAIKYKYLKFE